jgi:RHS repeat-associated protein
MLNATAFTPELGAFRMVSSSPSARGAARVALAVALAGIALVALAPPSIPSARAPAAVFPPGDTTTLYGPVQLSTPNGNATNHVERFAVAVTPGRRYTLRLVNGAPNGSARVTAGTVQLNGWETMTSGDLASGATLERVVQVRNEDTLFATVQGSAGAYVTVSVLATPDPSFLVFGPAHFIRTTGTPVTETRTFSISPTAAPPYRFCLTNGGEDGSNRVSSASIVLNHQDVFTQSQFNQHVASLMTQVVLQPANTLQVTLSGIPGGFLDLCVTATDTTPPQLTITAPPPNFITRDTLVTVAGSVQDETPTTVIVNGQAAPLTGGSFSVSTRLTIEGQNTIHVIATDAAGHTTDSTRTVTRDRTPPVLTVNAPVPGFITNQPSIAVSGTVSDQTTVTVNVNGDPLPVSGGAFTGSHLLTEGTNVLVITAIDAAGNETPVVRTGKRDTQPPVIALTSPAEGDSIAADSATLVGTVTDANPKTLTANGIGIALGQGGSFTGKVPLVVGPNTITLVATDSAMNNSAPFVRHVVRRNPLPPDPATVASVINRAEVTTTRDATAFLYTGATPIQTGVTASTIDTVRAAVVRGRVLDRTLQPLGGATVKILNHSELGQTLSRADGGYDLAVNGGGQLTLSFTLGGYLPAQRTVEVPWQDYTRLDDVVLLQPDPAVTVVDLTSPTPPVARGSIVSDADSARQATVIFKPGNTATLRRPDNTTQALTSLAVRVTEFTVGNDGPLAMPAELPPASQYTYAVQITADDQINAGPGATVTLAQPVPIYVRDFLHIPPTTTAIPVGAYDLASGRWVPQPNGTQVKVVTISSGKAQLDVTGDGVADDTTVLRVLGIDDYEQVQLAGAFPAGSDLWRALAPRFEPLDLNFPFVFVGTPPTTGKVKAGCSSREGDPLRCQLQVQTAFQQVGIVGSPFTLNYASDRTQGNVADRKLDITLTGPTLPPELKRVEFEVDVAGQRFRGSFADTAVHPNMKYTFTWDGRDLYGRLVQGTQPATVLIGYVFPVKYAAPPNAIDAFGLPCQPSGAGTVCPFIAQGVTPARAERTLVQRIETSIGTVDAVALGLGGFTLDVQNVYDPVGQVLYNGDGTRRTAASLPAGIRTVVGKPGSSITRVVNHVPALSFAVSGGSGPIAPAPDGSIYFADAFQTLIQRLSPDGFITTVAGKFPNGGAQCTGDNGAALSAGISFITGLTVAPDGTIYFTDAGNCQRVRKVEPNGTIRHVAGVQASAGFTGDGGRADTARLQNPGALGLGPDGSLYINDQSNRRIRKVAPDGIITTVAGDGTVCGPAISINTDAGFNNTCKNGVAATKAKISSVQDMVVAPDGAIYISYLGRVRRITPDGIIQTYAGNQDTLTTGDGGPATLAGIPGIWALARGPDGSIYVSQSVGNQTTAARVRRIASTGIITTFAGNGTPGFAGDGGPATAARIGQQLRGLTVGADGNLYLPDFDNARLRKVAGFLPGFGVGQTVIASEDGRELYVFNSAGRILLTVDPLTGDTIHPIHRFVYDDQRRLVSIIDRDGTTTTIERDVLGKPTRILSSNGQPTAITLNPDGTLAALTDAGNEALQFAFGTNGLLNGITDFNGNSPSHVYDASGLLLSSSDGTGGPSIARTVVPTGSGSQLTYASAAGMTSLGQVANLSGGGRSYQGTLPDGRVLQTTVGPDGALTTHFADGTVVTAVPLPDPLFGMQTPGSRVTTTLPSGLVDDRRSVRGLTLATPGDPLSLIQQVDSFVVNGRTSLTTFDKSAGTRTRRTPTGRLFVSTLDGAGRETSEQAPGVFPVSYQYDTAGRVTRIAQSVRFTSFTYGSNGKIRQSTDALGRVAFRSYSETGLLTELVRPGSDTVRFDYDENGNRTAIVPPGRPPHVFTYTATGNRETYTAPTIGPSPTITRWFYNPDGALIGVELPDSSNIAIQRDSAGQVRKVTSSTGQQTYSYNPGNGKVATAVSEQGVITSFAYDGSLLNGTQWSGPVVGSVSNTYDANHWLISQAVGSEAPIQFVNDLDGLPTRAGAVTISRNAASGAITGTTVGGLTSQWVMDGYGDPASIEYRFGGVVVLRLRYTRDLLGRVVASSVIRNSDSTGFSFAFDSVGRLTGVGENGATVAIYDYDANGNRARATTPGGTLQGTVDAQDRLLAFGSTSYKYSANGEVLEKVNGSDTTRYEYDGTRRLTAVLLPSGRRVSYLLDADGHRAARLIDGVVQQRFVYGSASNMLAEVDGNGNATSRFIYGTQDHVPDYMVKNGTVYGLLRDQVGSVRLVIDVNAGAIAQELDYDAFGQVTLNTNPGFQPFAFQGGILDNETGLMHFGLRDYDPYVGRWTSRDPLLFDGGEWNFYTFARNDPVNYIDPKGAQFLPEMAFSMMWDGLYRYVRNRVIGQVFANILENAAARAITGCWSGGLTVNGHQEGCLEGVKGEFSLSGLVGIGSEAVTQLADNPFVEFVVNCGVEGTTDLLATEADNDRVISPRSASFVGCMAGGLQGLIGYAMTKAGGPLARVVAVFAKAAIGAAFIIMEKRFQALCTNEPSNQQCKRARGG